MKKKQLVFIIIFCLSRFLSFSQVSINTTNPSGIFYIDGSGDNDTNSSASDNKFKDDLKVDANGSLILGLNDNETTNAKAKVDITVHPGNSALRIKDGNEEEGKVLFGDGNGGVQWGYISYGSKEKLYGPTSIDINGNAFMFDMLDGSEHLKVSVFFIPADGDYMIIVNPSMKCNKDIQSATFMFQLIIEDTTRDEVYVTENTQKDAIVAPYVVMKALNLKKGNSIKIIPRTQPITGNSGQTGLNSKTFSLDMDKSRITIYKL